MTSVAEQSQIRRVSVALEADAPIVDSMIRPGGVDTNAAVSSSETRRKTIDLSDAERMREDIPWGVRIAAEWGWRLIVLIVLIGIAVWLLGHVMVIVVPLMVAALLTTLVMPLHKLLLKLKFPRVLAALSSLLATAVVVVGIIYFVGQEILAGFNEMFGDIEEGFDEALLWVEQTAMQLGVDFSSASVAEWFQRIQNWLQENQDSIMSGAVGVGSAAGNFVIGSILVVFTMIFFLADGRRIWDFLTVFIPSKHRPAVHGAGRSGWATVGTYMRVQILVAAIDAIGIGLGAFLLEVPLWLPIAVLVFFGGFVPIVGAVATGAIAVVLAWVAHDFTTALIMLAVVIAVQQIESNILQPLIMGPAVKIHPLAVVLAVTAGTSLIGIIGALVAVPILAFINRASAFLVGEKWRDDPEAMAMEKDVKEAALRREEVRDALEMQDRDAIAMLRRRIRNQRWNIGADVSGKSIATVPADDGSTRQRTDRSATVNSQPGEDRS